MAYASITYLPAENLTKDIVTGQGVTMHSGSDCYPGTIVAIHRNGREIVVQSDETENGVEGTQFIKNNQGKLTSYTIRKNGEFLLKGQNFGIVSIGRRRKYLDPSF